jgi:hypothetical protein
MEQYRRNCTEHLDRIPLPPKKLKLNKEKDV